MPAPRHQAGFTIIELIVTIAVAALLLGVAIPAFNDLVRNNQMRTAVNSLAMDFAYARSEATKRFDPVVICRSDDGAACSTDADTTWSGGWLLFVDLDRDEALDAGEPLLRVRESMDAIAITTVNFDDFITFRRNGSANSAGRFEMVDDRGAPSLRVVCVSVAGSVRVQETVACGA